MHKPLTLSTAQKIGGIIVAIVMSVVSVTGTYMVFKATTDYRINEVERKVEKNIATIAHMSQFGFQGHETRIVRLETRSDDQQKTIAEMKAKLDVAVEILTRLDKKLDSIENKVK